MADPRFFENKGPFRLAEIAKAVGAEVSEGADPEMVIADIAPLDEATPETLSFLDNPKYLDAFRKSRAGACIIAPKNLTKAPDGLALLISPDPYRAYAKAAAMFYPAGVSLGSVSGSTGIHERASVDATACIAENVTIEAGAVIGAQVEIGAGTVIAANAVVGAGCTIGTGCHIGPNVSIQVCHIGDRVIIHAGASIGQDGFGFAMGLPAHQKVPQLGRVIIQDNVEIGANTTIDRGAGPDTVIGEGTKIDNLVQIGHNVSIGRGCIIVSQVGISGSTKLEDFVVLAARVGVTGHLTIGAGSQIAARSSVIHDVPPGSRLGGTPAKPIREWQRELIAVQRLGRRPEKT